MKVALHQDVLRACRAGHDDVWQSLAGLVQFGATLWVVPAVADELASSPQGSETAGGGGSTGEQALPLHHVEADEFLKGCAAGMARRYLDYHPDPQDCRVVAEAECARMDVLVTQDRNLISGLGGRAENLRIQEPSEALSGMTDHRSES